MKTIIAAGLILVSSPAWSFCRTPVVETTVRPMAMDQCRVLADRVVDETAAHRKSTPYDGPDRYIRRLDNICSALTISCTKDKIKITVIE